MKAKYLALLLVFSAFSLEIYSQPKGEISAFEQRRNDLMEKLADGFAVFVSPDADHESRGVFRQNSAFYYLTGFEEPGSAFILNPSGNEKFIMFVQPRNPGIEVWTGKRYGTEGAVGVFRADLAFDIDKLDSVIDALSSGIKKIYFAKDINPEFSEKLQDRVLKSDRGKSLVDISDIIDEMRLFKSPHEVELLQKAIDITCDALIESMKSAKPGMYEYELQALLEYNFRKNGSRLNGFPPIVGSGPNSCILHYEKNERQMQDGDLVVMDVGAEYGYYTADVTRTFPVNGKFSREQKEIYQIVLDAQKEAISFIRPGVKYYQVDSVARSVVSSGLRKLGILNEGESDRKFFMHSTSHWLGMDVHDPGKNYTTVRDARDRPLEAGMVLTVEPGIYIPEGTEGVDPKYYNIGVRIEDDILVTSDGSINLSKKAPREIGEIEL